MSHKRVHPSQDFRKDRDILDFRPDIHYIEPAQIAEEVLHAPEVPTVDTLRSDLDELRTDYADIETLAHEAQERIDQKASNLVIHLDEENDAHLIDVARRHLGTDGHTISYGDYKKCINDIYAHSAKSALTLSQSDIDNAASDPYRTKFGHLGKLPGLGRPELNKKVQIMKPINLADFKVQTLIILAINLLELLTHGPIGKIVGPIIRRLIGWLRKKLKKGNSFKLGPDNTIINIGNSTVHTGNAIGNGEKPAYPTEQQDCHILVDAYERGCHFSDTEASAYAPLTRNVQNTILFAKVTQTSLDNYNLQTKLSNKTKAQLSGTPESSLQGLKLNNHYIAIPDSKTAGSVLSRAIKECIPCSFRPLSSIDISISAPLVDALKADVKSRLKTLASLADLLKNINIYSDYCQLLKLLDFMCIPDLQRMLVVLASMLFDNGIALSSVAGLLMKLVAPFFAPILLSLRSLLDYITQLVLEPLKCIITAINEQSRKLMLNLNVHTPNINISVQPNPTLTSANRGINQEAGMASAELQNTVHSLLNELSSALTVQNEAIRRKIMFYTDQIAKLLHSWGGHDTSYLALTQKKLIAIRLIGIIASVIQARKQGNKICNTGSPDELNHFFNNYVNPNSSFSVNVDPQGNVVIGEPVGTNLQGKKLNQITITAKPLLKARNIDFTPTTKTFKCKFETSDLDVERVNRWIDELDRS